MYQLFTMLSLISQVNTINVLSTRPPQLTLHATNNWFNQKHSNYMHDLANVLPHFTIQNSFDREPRNIQRLAENFVWDFFAILAIEKLAEK